MAEGIIRYFHSEAQEAALHDILVADGKQRSQPPKDGREWVYDTLTNAAVQASVGVNQVYDEARVQLANGMVLKLSRAELDAEKVDADPKWRPEGNPEAKMRILKVGELLYNSLLKAAALENAVQKQINGSEVGKFPCLEAYVSNILNSILRTNTAQNLLRELQAEKKAVLAEKEDLVPKPAEKKKKLEPITGPA